MTKPLPIGQIRTRRFEYISLLSIGRRYKSCLHCREKKAKCLGLDEEYLHALDDRDYRPVSPAPRCERCIERDLDCVFAPSRRKGRPRRLADRAKRLRSATPPLLPSSLSTRHSPAPRSPSTSVSSRSSLSPAPSASPSGTPPPPPELPLKKLPRISPVRIVNRQSQLTSARTQSRFPRPLSSAPVVGGGRPWVAAIPILPTPLDSICERYLSGIFVWNPLLPPDKDRLMYHLSRCDTHLLAAVNCSVDPCLGPPPFPPPTARVSLSILQAAVFFFHHAYGVKDYQRAHDVIVWAASVIERLGWNGFDTSKLSSSIERNKIPAFVECGWTIHSLLTWLESLTGKKDSVLVGIETVKEVTPSTVLHHAVALLRDGTDMERFRRLSNAEQSTYSRWILDRSSVIYQATAEHLTSTSRSLDPRQRRTSDSLILESERETAFVSSMLASASTILHLSRNSPRLPFLISRPTSEPLDSISLSPSTRIALSRAAQQVLSLARSIRNRQGFLLALQPHTPLWSEIVLVIAYGLIAGAELSFEEEGGGGGGGSTATPIQTSTVRQLEEDLDFCDLMLVHQLKWPRTERVRFKLKTLRERACEIASVVVVVKSQREALPQSLASLLN